MQLPARISKLGSASSLNTETPRQLQLRVNCAYVRQKNPPQTVRSAGVQLHLFCKRTQPNMSYKVFLGEKHALQTGTGRSRPIGDRDDKPCQSATQTNGQESNLLQPHRSCYD
jgi:hypothetical protein